MVNLDIIYEDNHIIVAIKPFNILSQSDKTGEEDMLTILKTHIKEKQNKPGNVYLGLVHRLDRPAGGIMVFAKTSKAASRISEKIRNKEFGKTYLIVVNGVPDILKGTLTHYLKKDSITNTVKTSISPKDGYKKAILEYEVLEQNKNLTLIKVNLITGRSHQIRVQFAAIDSPLYGDVKYSGNKELGNQLALWSTVLEFEHPVKHDIVKYITKPPKELPWEYFNINKYFGDDKNATFR